VQGTTERTSQPIAIHAVTQLQVPNGGLYRCSPFQPALLLLCQTTELTPVISAYPAPQINHYMFEFEAQVLIANNFSKNVAASCTPEKDGQTRLNRLLSVLTKGPTTFS
jgi:hypothetical protein